MTDKKHIQTPASLCALYSVLASIPEGKVISYGQLANYAGLGRAARFVARSLAQLPPDSSLPWHRVVRADGRIALPADHPSGIEQRYRLAQEGLILHADRVNLRVHHWHPEHR